MGGAASIDISGDTQSVCDQMCGAASYYVADAAIDASQLELVQKQWKLILENEAPVYVAKENINIPCVDWFFDKFFHHSSALDEHAEFNFNSAMKIKIRELVESLMNAVCSYTDTDALNVVLKNIAIEQNKKETEAFQYVSVGECLVTSLVDTLGEAAWDDAAQLAWKTIYSVLLKVLVISALEVEKASAEASGKPSPAKKPPRPLQTGSKATSGGHCAHQKRGQFFTQSSGRVMEAAESAKEVLEDHVHTEADTKDELEHLTKQGEGGGGDAAATS